MDSIHSITDLELCAENTVVMLTCVVCADTPFIGCEAWQRAAAYFGPITSQISGPEWTSHKGPPASNVPVFHVYITYIHSYRFDTFFPMILFMQLYLIHSFTLKINHSLILKGVKGTTYCWLLPV